MSATLFDSSPPLKFVAETVQGDATDIADFNIFGEPAVVTHDWTAQVSSHSGRVVLDLAVDRSIVTVTTADDSARVTLRLSAEHSALLRPGIYWVAARDLDTDRTWAAGTLRVARDHLS